MNRIHLDGNDLGKIRVFNPGKKQPILNTPGYLVKTEPDGTEFYLLIELKPEGLTPKVIRRLTNGSEFLIQNFKPIEGAFPEFETSNFNPGTPPFSVTEAKRVACLGKLSTIETPATEYRGISYKNVRLMINLDEPYDCEVEMNQFQTC